MKIKITNGVTLPTIINGPENAPIMNNSGIAMRSLTRKDEALNKWVREEQEQKKNFGQNI